MKWNNLLVCLSSAELQVQVWSTEVSSELWGFPSYDGVESGKQGVRVVFSRNGYSEGSCYVTCIRGLARVQ